LTVEYDKTGDILYLGKTKCYPEQESEELDYGVIARLNSQTHELENLEISSFSSLLFFESSLHEAFFIPWSWSVHLPALQYGQAQQRAVNAC
jgi:hypothetical protein